MDLCCVRIAVVRVARPSLEEPLAGRTIRELQRRFGVVPILLVAFEGPDLGDVRGYSEFPTAAYLAELVEWNGMEPIEWAPLPELAEEELPF